jgi:hypothetical protein
MQLLGSHHFKKKMKTCCIIPLAIALAVISSVYTLLASYLAVNSHHASKKISFYHRLGIGHCSQDPITGTVLKGWIGIQWGHWPGYKYVSMSILLKIPLPWQLHLAQITMWRFVVVSPENCLVLSDSWQACRGRNGITTDSTPFHLSKWKLIALILHFALAKGDVRKNKNDEFNFLAIMQWRAHKRTASQAAS